MVCLSTISLHGLCACTWRDRDSKLSGVLSHRQGPALMTSSHPHHLPRAPARNTTMLEVREVGAQTFGSQQTVSDLSGWHSVNSQPNQTTTPPKLTGSIFFSFAISLQILSWILKVLYKDQYFVPFVPEVICCEIGVSDMLPRVIYHTSDLASRSWLHPGPP